MNKLQMTFEQFLATQSVRIPVLGFAINLLLAAVLAYILTRAYIKYGYSLSNRRMFAKNFILITMTTMLIISIVKSSLALSLGLVGALSIIRFRAAIKEPEELSYLFICIAIGLGLGADQTAVTIIGFFIIIAFIWLRRGFTKVDETPNLHLTITSTPHKKVTLDSIVQVLESSCEAVRLRRFDETKDILEASFVVEYEDFEQMKNCKTELQKLDDSIRITFLETMQQ